MKIFAIQHSNKLPTQTQTFRASRRIQSRGKPARLRCRTGLPSDPSGQALPQQPKHCKHPTASRRIQSRGKPARLPCRTGLPSDPSGQALPQQPKHCKHPTASRRNQSRGKPARLRCRTGLQHYSAQDLLKYGIATSLNSIAIQPWNDGTKSLAAFQ